VVFLFTPCDMSRGRDMTRRADFRAKATEEEQSCFGWIPEFPCLARQRILPIAHNEVKEVRPASVHREHGSALWGPGPDHEEMLQVVIPELPTARAFFERFIADAADYSILDGDLPPWNEHMFTDSGEMDHWTEERTRKMSFLAYPVPPGWMPQKKYILRIEHYHSYQFAIDRSDGAEVLQFEAQIEVNLQGAIIPYADCFTMRQLWTVRPVPGPQPGCPTVCQLHVTAEINFKGRAPLLAPVIRSKAYSEHRAGTQGWLKGARASIERLNSTDLERSVPHELDTLARQKQAQLDDGRKEHAWVTSHWVCFMVVLLCVLWAVFAAGRAWGRFEVMITQAAYPSGSDLSISGMEPQLTRNFHQ